MRRLSERVHTRIRATGAMDPHFLAKDIGERRFQEILDAVSAGLTLPARERTAVVGNDEAQPARHLKRGEVFGCFAAARILQAIEIRLQNHLRCDLIDDSAGLFGFFPGSAESTIGRGCR